MKTDKKRAEEILENELNNIGFSFKEQLKPDDITLAEVRKTKKAIVKAILDFHNERLRQEHSQFVQEKKK